MDRQAFVRRAFHLTSPAWLIWYWMPPDAWIGVRKEFVLLFFLCGALLIEAARLIVPFNLPGLRDYESDRLSAYAWGSIGLAIGLWFFPGELVIPTFWGMAWIDPLCAKTKTGRMYPFVPFVAYAGLAVALMIFVVPLAPYQTTPITGPGAPLRILGYSLVAAVLAILAERPNWWWVDDDFLMHIVPLLGLFGLSRIV